MNIYIVSSGSAVHYASLTESLAQQYKQLLEDKCGYANNSLCPNRRYWITKLELEKVKGRDPFINI